jgi:hypothetical protein
VEIRFSNEKPTKNGLYLIRRTKDTCPMLFWILAHEEACMPVERGQAQKRIMLQDLKGVEFAMLGEEIIT